MRKKRLLVWILILVVIALIVLAWRLLKEDDYAHENEQLRNLLPDTVGYRWVYYGFAEYGHTMQLQEIQEERDNAANYYVCGEVEDVSGGESGADYSISLQYMVKEGKLIQNFKAEMMMDTAFKDLILIQTPLEKGATWEQTVEGPNERSYDLEVTIENVAEADDGCVYTVKYQDKNSKYYEIREIKEGVGVIKYTKLYMSSGEDFEIGYMLYESASGVE